MTIIVRTDHIVRLHLESNRRGENPGNYHGPHELHSPAWRSPKSQPNILLGSRHHGPRLELGYT